MDRRSASWTLVRSRDLLRALQFLAPIEALTLPSHNLRQASGEVWNLDIAPLLIFMHCGHEHCNDQKAFQTNGGLAHPCQFPNPIYVLGGDIED